MKLALIGGGGLRAPLFVDCARRRAAAIGLTHVVLMDTDADQLALIAPICEALVARSGGALRVTATTDADEALRGADFVVTTIRPGGIDGRIADETIATQEGVLGQETTGAGGFAMALRSIPTILGYARRMADLCPDAWLINFTNPAGLVTQALHDAGFGRIVGICDSANGAQTAVARALGVPTQAVEADLFGLNHLSFSPAVHHDGRDVLPDLLARDDFLATTALSVFDPALVRRRGMWINEYLWYFWAIDAAMAAQRAKGGRGAEIATLNAGFVPRLKTASPDAALSEYMAYEAARSGSYMASARPAGASAPEVPPDGEGYAGVAFDVIGALRGTGAIRTGLNVPNAATLSDLAPDDIVEVSCRIDAGGIKPVPFGAMPSVQRELVGTVKLYERLCVEAVARRDRALAVDALMVHPLVLSRADGRPAGGPVTRRPRRLHRRLDMSARVFVTGEYFCDLVFGTVDAPPAPGREVFGTGPEIVPGGTFNIAAGLARAGVPTAWGVEFGTDPFSALVRAAATEAGVDPVAFRDLPHPVPRLSAAFSVGGDRGFLSASDAPVRPVPAPGTDMPKTAWVVQTFRFTPDWIAAARTARAQGARLFGDCRDVEATLETPGVRDLLDCLDVFAPGADEAMRLTETTTPQQALTVLAAIVPVVIVTRGAQGAIWAADGATGTQPTPTVHVVDTIGAGDAFNCGYICAALAGAGIAESVRAGCVFGAHAVTRPGGGHAPDGAAFGRLYADIGQAPGPRLVALPGRRPTITSPSTETTDQGAST